jgi:hypothetical protein
VVARCDTISLRCESWMVVQQSPPGRHLGASLPSLVQPETVETVSRGTACWAGTGLGGTTESGAEGIKDHAEDTSDPVPAWEPPGVGSTRLGDTLHKSEAKSGSTTCPKPGGGGQEKGGLPESRGTTSHWVGCPEARGVKGSSPPPIPFTGGAVMG